MILLISFPNTRISNIQHSDLTVYWVCVYKAIKYEEIFLIIMHYKYFSIKISHREPETAVVPNKLLTQIILSHWTISLFISLLTSSDTETGR